ncbi:PQQ-dependent sugar dehydrogenase [Demequina sp. NBRC 110051]|uniref:PQQ-dependent sugar dehydrogenase n=1 Tax=Demequina sp. NBRC 110051 TaxID=1570340 RepID=UPI000A0784B4|nr:PQQ-dependent sugar dehydrogenase [Demequina sp. NBRC 110051]
MSFFGVRLWGTSPLLRLFQAVVITVITAVVGTLTAADPVPTEDSPDSVEQVLAPAETPAEPLSLEGFTDEAVLTAGLNQPISMAFLPDGRMLVLEKEGRILIGNPGTVPMQTQAYMTLTNIDVTAERGLIDIALDPQFETNGYLYVYYHPATPGKGRISRFTHTENAGGLTSRASTASEMVVWQDTTGYTSCCHYGGGLDIGPDGNLWLTNGDKFDGERAQDLTDASGSIIRVATDGSVPADNPFADGAGGANPYIWAYGLRNPFRASWDTETNRMFVGEVGGNDVPESWEDVHLVKYDEAYRGLNYQWPYCEGPAPYTDFPECPIVAGDEAEPIFAYQHANSADNNASLTGGFVYRGTQFPAAWDGVYFYGDYTRHMIRYLTFDESGETVTGDFPFRPSEQIPGNPTTVVSIEQGGDGALYYALIATGQIRRVVYEGGNQAPSVTSAAADVTEGPTPLDVEFTASATDPEGDQVEYTWHFGDGTTATGATASHTYTVDGPYDAYVSVSDGSHTVASDSIRIQAGVAPDVEITSPVGGALFRAGDTIAVSGSASDDGTLDDADYAWTVQFGHDNHFHPADLIPNGPSGEFEIPTSGHDYSNETWYRVTLTVTDADGLVGTDTVEVFPDKVDLTLATEPAGLIVNLDSVPRSTPWVHDTLIGFEHTVTARTPQCLDGEGYVFDHWSDGGAASHVATVPDVDSTLTAVFTASGPCAAPVTEGLVMRLQGDQGVTASGGAVTAWSDLTSSGNALAATTGSPSLITGALAGHNVVSFDGVDDGMGRSGFAGLPTDGADRSVFALVRYDGSSTTGGWAGFTYGAPYTGEAWGPVRTSDGDLGIQGWGGAGDADSDSPADGEGWLVQSIVLDDDAWVHYRDGVEIDAGTQAYDTGADRIRLGAELNDNRKVAMDVAEILVYDRAVSPTEQAQIQDYFAQAYLDGIVEEPEPPTVTITAPTDGQTVRGGDVAVTWQTGGGFAAGDHVHLTLDDGEHVTVMGATGTHTFTGVAEGPHTVTATVADASHGEYEGPGAIDSVDFSVSLAPLTGDFPADGLALHLESDLNVIKDGANHVGGWLDQSGRGNDLDDPHGDPEMTTSPSGMPAIAFDGDADALERDGGLNGMPLGDADRTVAVVASYDSGGWGGFAWGAPYCGMTFGTGVSATGNLALQGWCADHDSGVAGTGAGWLVQAITYDGSTFAHYRDGVEIDDGTVALNTAADRIILGAEVDGAPTLDMDVAAVVVYDRVLDGDELAQLTAYLDEKYISGEVEDGPPTVPAGLTADPGDAQVALTWGPAADANGDLEGYHVYRAEQPGAIDPAVDSPIATVTEPSYLDTGVVNGVSYTYAVTAFDAAGHESAASATADAIPAAPEPDTTPPAAPAALTATAGIAKVTLEWDDSGEPDLDEYLVYRAAAPATPDPEADTPLASVTDSGYVDTDVTAGTAYAYVVTAVDETGNQSAGSTAAQATPTAPPVPGVGCAVPYASDTVLCLVSTTGVSGPTVSAWADQSTAGNDLDLVTGDPTLGDVQTPSGLPAVSFDGDGDSLRRVGSLQDMPLGAADRTVVTVVRYDSVGWGGFSWGAPYCGMTFGTTVATDGDLAVQGWCADHDSGVAGTGTGWLVQSVVYRDEEFVHYRDGAEIGAGAYTYTTAADQIMLGAEIDGNPSLDMDVAAVLVFDRALSAAEHQEVIDSVTATYLG